MASSRRGQPPLAVRLPQNTQPVILPDLPPISALFLIDFDVKAGYTIVWKQAIPDIELEGVVEYKSLPSGLHTVKDDLIYFVHEGGHAGLSAFVNVPCDEEGARHARMIAVGVLVPLSYGRLGRAWRHAEGLKEMATKLAEDRKGTGLLEQYWEENHIGVDAGQEVDASETPLGSPSVSFQSLRQQRGHTRNRSASDGTALLPPGHKLSPYHPAWSLTKLLDTFGPLIFPIHRAALLRKRILISCHAPVRETCDFVYDLSILSNIPLSVAQFLPPIAPTQRLRPLFTIGIHDIPLLLEDMDAAKQQLGEADEDGAAVDDSATGWIACTTDSILAMKDTLWDMLITMPPPFASQAAEKVWPTVECPRGLPIRATQRDLRRFVALKAGLARIASATTPTATSTSTPGIGILEDGSVPTSTTAISAENSNESVDKVVEPVTWAALAYSGFMWWASAGEQARSDEHEESARDASLLADLSPPSHTPAMSMPTLSTVRPPLGAMSDSISSLTARRASGAAAFDEQARVELAIIAYFHRLTTQIITVLADAVETADDHYEDDDDSDSGEDVLLRPGERDGSNGAVRLDSNAMESMGLDVWSTRDAEFVKELMERFFGRESNVEGKGVEVCGVRVC